MQKKDELQNPKSCLNKAFDDEMVFVLLARDPCAPSVIREWCEMRVRRGLNAKEEPQIVEALECAKIMEIDYKEFRNKANDRKYIHAKSIIANLLEVLDGGAAVNVKSVIDNARNFLGSMNERKL